MPNYYYGHMLNFYSSTVVIPSVDSLTYSTGYGFQCPNKCAVDIRCGTLDECWYFYNEASYAI